MTRASRWIPLIAVLAFATTGCAKLVLQHKALTPASVQAGSMSLVVNNARDAEHGADNPKLVGRTRNMWGMPIKLEADNSLVKALESLYADALAAAGYKVADGAATQVVVDVNTFFMDGYMGYKIETSSTVKAVDGGSTVFQKEIVQNNGFAYVNNNDLYLAFDQLMDMIAKQAIDTFSSPDFKAVVQ